MNSENPSRRVTEKEKEWNRQFFVACCGGFVAMITVMQFNADPRIIFPKSLPTKYHATLQEFETLHFQASQNYFSGSSSLAFSLGNNKDSSIYYHMGVVSVFFDKNYLIWSSITNPLYQRPGQMNIVNVTFDKTTVLMMDNFPHVVFSEGRMYKGFNVQFRVVVSERNDKHGLLICCEDVKMVLKDITTFTAAGSVMCNVTYD